MPAGRDETIETARRIVAAIDQNHHELDEREQERLQALRAAGERLLAVCQVVPYEWVTAQWENVFEGTVDPVVAALESFVSSDPPSAFPITWQHVTHVWGMVQTMLPAVPGLLDEDLAQEVTAFRKHALAELNRIREAAASSSVAIDEQTTRLTELDQARRESIAHFDARRVEIDTTINEHVTRLEAAIRQNQDQFSNAQESNRREFARLLEEGRESLKEGEAALQSDMRKMLDSTSTDAHRVLERLAELERKATKSYQAVGTASVAGFFQTEANEQRKAANRWRLAGVLALVLFAVAAVLELFIGDATPSLEHTAARLPIAIAVAALATYCLRESGHHRQQERRLRQREVDVSTIDPYLANIQDAEESEKLKLDHARHLFLSPSDESEGKDQHA